MSSSDTGIEPTKFFTPKNEEFYSANQYTRLNPDNREIRILEILPGADNGMIQCKLVEPPQSANLPYECISYRAGDPSLIHQIEVNGYLFNAFASLGAALHQLRLPDQSRFLWADQICINQSDVTERSSQVQQMGRVYEKANKVHAWLGSLENSHLVMQGLHHLQFEFSDACRAYVETIGNEHLLTPVQRQSIYEQIAHSLEYRCHDEKNEDVARYSAIGPLWQSEFWDRLWITQELIVAKAVNLMWDSCSINLDDIHNQANIISSLIAILDGEGRPIHTSTQPHLVRLAGGLGARPIQVARLRNLRNKWKQKKSIDFKNLLSSSYNRRCSDPRDRVFAFCGLISDQYSIVPDYTSSIQSVYVYSVLSIVAAERSLDVLAYCRHPRSYESTQKFPTWCPDWSSPISIRNRRQSLLWDDAGSGVCKFKASKGASGQCHWKSSVTEDGMVTHVSLYTEGILLGTVQEIGKVPPLVTERPEEGFEQLVKCWSELTAQQRPLTLSVLEELEKTAIIDDRGYPDVVIPRDAINASNYQRLKLDAVEGNRLFIVTDSGYMGMAPPHVKAGDSVCVLLGARVPFLLRKESEFYTLVGELYLSDGFMTGKAIDMMEAGELRKTTFEIR
jgi:hypothetical protein